MPRSRACMRWSIPISCRRRDCHKRHGSPVYVIERRETMTPRCDVNKYLGSGMVKELLRLSQEVATSGREPRLLELVKIRASQINGCAYCLDMHTKDARAMGETE